MRRVKGYSSIFWLGLTGVMVMALVCLVLGFSGQMQRFVLSSRLTQAQSLAYSALNLAGSRLVTEQHSEFLTCGSLAQNFTNVAHDNGHFTVTGTLKVPDPHSRLVVASTPESATRLCLNGNASSYADFGRVWIDHEAIDYEKIECSNLQDCQTDCELVLLARGVAGTASRSHAVGSVVSQNQCQLQADSDVVGHSTVAQVEATRYVTLSSLPEAWSAVGTKVYQWNGAQWVTSLSALDNLTALYGLSYQDIWVVGQNGKTYYWQGQTWQQKTTPTTATLNAISCQGSIHCRAVGDNATFIYWDGSSWTLEQKLTDPTSAFKMPNTALNSVRCTEHHCWAVGDHDTTDSVIAERVSGVWQLSAARDSSIPLVDYHSVDCVDDDLCYAVGDQAGQGQFTILLWNGLNWKLDSAAPSNGDHSSLRAVRCLPSGECWAVGEQNSSGVILRLQTGQWHNSPSLDTGVTLSGLNLTAVSCVGPNNCWVVDGQGDVLKWNGSVWKEGDGLSTHGPTSLVQFTDPTQKLVFWH